MAVTNSIMFSFCVSLQMLAFLSTVAAIELSHTLPLNGMAMDSMSMETASENGPEIQWGTNETHIEVQLSYPTLGWLALGLSPNGAMDQSDVLFGYVNDQTGEVVVQVINDVQHSDRRCTV